MKNKVKKDRLDIPYEYYWLDKYDHLHECKYLVCGDGCLCEKWVVCEEIPKDINLIIKLIKKMIEREKKKK